MNNREAFEAWLKFQFPKENLSKLDNGVYKREVVQAAWIGYEAALYQASQAQQEPVMPERNMLRQPTINLSTCFVGGLINRDTPEVAIGKINKELEKSIVEYFKAQQPTDLSKQLREYAADSGYSHNDYADTMLAAASEIERCAARLAASQAQQPTQEPYGWHIKGLENAGMRYFFTVDKIDAEYWQGHGMTLVPVYLQSQAQQEPYAYDVPTKSGTKLAYAIYYTKYNNPLPEGAIPLYFIPPAPEGE